MFNRILKNNKWINVIILLMFLLSSIFTIRVYVGEAVNVLDMILLGGMGLAIQSSIAFVVLYLVKFLQAKKKLLSFLALLTLIALTFVSIKCNISYTESIDNNLKNDNKIISQEYKNLNDDLNDIETHLNDAKNDVNETTIQMKNTTIQINELMNAKIIQMNKLKNTWEIKQQSAVYDNDINRLNESFKSLERQKIIQMESFKSFERSFESKSDEMKKVNKYQEVKTSFSDDKFRKFLGVLFELITIILFIFKSCSVKKIVKVEEKEIKKEEPKKEKMKEVKNKTSKGKVININKKKTDHDKYLEYIRKNASKDNVIPSDNEVINKTGLSKYKVTKIKNDLYKDNIIKKIGNKTIRLIG